MTAVKNIDSEDLSIAKVFLSFYRVPDYQREYVWGEDSKGERGDEVEQFLADIYSEYEQLTSNDPTEYFIGTMVVCDSGEGTFDLIDGQQRTTTSFLTLCAIRDALKEGGFSVPSTLDSQIYSSDTNWKGETVAKMRLELQYSDAADVLIEYGNGNASGVDRSKSRSINNLAGAYNTIRQFLAEKFSNGEDLKAFHGFFTNQVKLIRIQTPSVSRALKIFETINDRGTGLDAMDLLKNRLFMHADREQFEQLKAEWKSINQEIFQAREKPLRFLRYFILANFKVKEMKLREDQIYDWFVKSNDQTNHASDPLGFAAYLKSAARAYKHFSNCESAAGNPEQGLKNTRQLGGPSFKQHFILLLAGRHLSGENFTTLCENIEELICLWLIADVPAKVYDGLIIKAAAELRAVKTDQEFQLFIRRFFDHEKYTHRGKFVEKIEAMSAKELRQYRLRYILAKITQHFDIDAFGGTANDRLEDYLSKIEIEHVHPVEPDDEALSEFGEAEGHAEIVQRLGNLILLEKSLNAVVSNSAYSKKCEVYPTSKFLLTRCQKEHLQSGVNDKVTKAMARLNSAPQWSYDAIIQRQKWYADVAQDVWRLRNSREYVAEAPDPAQYPTANLD